MMKVPGDRVPGPHGHLLSGPWAPAPLPCGRGERAGSGTEAQAQAHEEAGRAGRLTGARAQRLALRLYNSEPRGEFESPRPARRKWPGPPPSQNSARRRLEF